MPGIHLFPLNPAAFCRFAVFRWKLHWPQHGTRHLLKFADSKIECDRGVGNGYNRHYNRALLQEFHQTPALAAGGHMLPVGWCERKLLRMYRVSLDP